MSVLRAFRRARDRAHARRRAQRVRQGRRVLHEVLEDRLLLDGVPVAALTLPADVLTGETFSASIEFSNASATDVGFGPYVDLLLPTNGADGAAGTDTPDGVTFNSATFLGTPVMATTLTFDALGQAQHPYAKTNTGAPQIVSGTPGDQLVVLLLPFGSYAPGQTPAVIDVSLSLSNLADVGTPLTIQSRGGFQFGGDPLDNPTVDPSTIGAFDTGAISPQLVRVTKSPIAPEDETATGPNFPRQFEITIDVADGQTLSDLTLTDVLDDSLQFVSIDSISPAGSVVDATPSLVSPGGTLQIRFPTITGTASANDVTATFSYFVPDVDAGSASVLDPNSGDDRSIPNTVDGSADWTPIDPRDPVTTVSDSETTQIIARSIAIQKSGTLVAPDVGGTGPSAGDTIEFTLQFQISDYFAFGNLSIADVLSDGLRVDPGFAPLFSVADRGGVLVNAPLLFGTDVTIGAVTPSPGPGTQTLTFDVSGALVRLGQADGVLQGALAGPAAPGTPATVGQIVFRAVIQPAFVGSPAVISGDPSLSQGDFVTNAVTLGGTVRDPAALGAVLGFEADTSSSRFDVGTGTLSKSIYALNGNTVIPATPTITAGDTVTFRLVYQLPTSDVENFRIEDFLPLPIFAAGDLTVFDAVVSATPPVAGHAQFGASDTFSGLPGAAVPAITFDATQNRVRFDFGDFDFQSNTPSTVEILFTMPVLDTVFADALFLTNQATATEGNTFSTATNDNAIAQLVYSQPVLAITKGVVATSNGGATFNPLPVGPVAFNAPGTAGARFAGTITSTNLAATPVDSNLTGVDAGDLVTFAIVLENTGTGVNGAFDITVTDSLPAGFVIPAAGAGLNLRVTDGTGAVMTSSGNLFAGGIVVDDPGPTVSPAGALDPVNPTSGRNVLVITFDLEVVSTVAASTTITNTATLTNFAAQEGGTDQTPTDLTDTASVTTTQPGLTKAVVATSLAQTGSSQGNAALQDLAIGETVTFEMVITVPEGQNPFVLTDNLPTANGILSLVSATLVSVGSSLSGPNVGTPGITISDVNLVDGFDDRAVFDFGTVTNTSDGVSNAGDQITVRITARVEDVAANAQPDVLRNTATLDFGTGTRSATADVEIVEPRLSIAKTANVATVDAGDVVTYTVVISHTGASRAPAFDLVVADLLQANLTLVAGSVTATLGATITDGNTVGDTAVQVDLGELLLGQTLTITYQAAVIATVAPSTTIPNTADLDFDSLPGAGGRTQALSDGASVAVPAPTLTKTVFATSLTQTGSSQFNGSRVDLAIGETVTFDLTITLPEGQSTLTLTDDLPTLNGILSLISGQVQSIGANLSGSLLAVGDPGVDSDVNLVDGFLDRAVFSFGTITNAPDGVSNAGDQIVVRIVARAENVAANAAGDNLVNSATLNYGTGSVSATRGVDIVEPRLDIQKSVAPTAADAGDLVTYTVVVSHLGTSTAPAFDLVIADLLNPNLALVAGSVTTTLGATVTSGNGVGDPSVQVDLGELLLGQTLTITYQATLVATVAAGTTIPNTADLDFDSHPGDFAPGQPGRQQADSDGASVTVTAPQIDKSVVDSSLAQTGTSQFNPLLTDLAIGETVTFEVVVTLQEGQTPIVITDNLPTTNGILSFVSAQLVSTGANLSGPNLATPTITASDVNLVDGFDDRVVFDFGTVTNAADGVSNAGDQIVVRIVARVENVAANAAGDVLTNAATVAFGTGSASDTAQVEIVEPDVEVTKSVTPLTADAGDTVTYTVVVENLAANGSTAPLFDLLVSDLLGPNLLLVVGSVTSTAGVVATGNGVGDTTIEVQIPELAINGSVTITYQVTLSAGVVSGGTESNIADATGDSLPGPGGRTYTDQDGALITIPGAQLSKLVVDSSNPLTGSGEFNPAVEDATIGETVTFELVITVPEGSTTLLLVDNAPFLGGVLEVLSAQVVSVGANLSGPNLANPMITISDSAGGDGINDTASIEFGPVTNAADGIVTAADRIVVRIVTRVPDVAANQSGDVLTNTATLDFGSGTQVATADVELVEPQLQIDKSSNVTGGAPGDPVTYTVVVSHTGASTSAGVDVVVEDLLGDANLVFVPGSVTVSLGNAVVTTGNGVGDSSVRVDLPFLSLGQTLTITYQATIAASAPAAVNATNSATTDWTSDPDGAGRPGTDSDSVTIVTAPDLAKSITATSVAQTGAGQGNPALQDLVIGETVTFQLVITVPEGVSTLLLTDQLPFAPGVLELVSASLISVGASLSGPNVGAPGITISDANLTDGLNDRVVFDFGAVTNTPGGAVAGADDRIVVQVVARVANVPANTNGDVLTNTATLDYSGVAGTGSVQDQAAVEIVEPLLDVQKSVSSATADAGDLLTYSVVVTHLPGSTAPAFDLSIADALGPNLLLVAGSVTTSLGGAVVTSGNGVGDTSVTVDLSELLLGQTLTITYQVQIGAPALLGSTLTNTAQLDYDSLPGPGGRTGTDSDGAAVVLPTPTLAKSVVATSVPQTGANQGNPALQDLVIGETVTFDLVVTMPEGSAPLLLTDLLPTGGGILSLVSSQVLSIGSSLSGSLLPVGAPGIATDTNFDGLPDRIVFDFGTVTNNPDGVANAGDQIVVRIVALAADVAANSAGDVLTNQSTLDFGTGTANADAAIEIVEPALTIDKSVNDTTPLPGQTLTFTVVVSQTAGSTASAFDLVIADLLDPNLTLVAGSVTTSLGVVTTGNGGGDTSMRVDVAELPLGQSLTITYQATVLATAAGATITNTAQLGFDSLPGPGGRTDGGSDTVTETVGSPGLTKGVVASSNPLTGAGQFSAAVNDLTIGETVTFEIVITAPDGAAPLILTDDLPIAPGLLQVISSQVVSIGSNLSGSALGVGASGIASDANLVDGLLDRVVFDFGNVTNAGDNVVDARDRIVVRITARVPDVAANQSGDVLTNTATLDFGSGTQVATADVELVEPQLQIDKSSNVTGGAPGDLVTYTVVVSHTGASTSAGVDVVVEDLLGDANLVFVPGSVTVSLGNAVVTTGNGVGDSSVRVDLPFLSLGQTLTITYQATIAASAPAAVNATNSATTDWTSDPDGSGRPGTDSDSVTIVTAPDLAKSITATSVAQTGAGQGNPALQDLVIGETVTFQLVITVPEGVSTLLLTDQLPFAPGVLELVSASLISVGASLSGPSVGAPGITISDANLADGLNDRVVFDFGAVTNTPGGAVAGADDQIIVQVVARVANVPANTNGDVLTNTATLDYSGVAGTGSVQDQASVEIVEPLLDVQKSVSSATADAGDVLTYSVVVTHLPGSTAPGFDLSIADALGPNLLLVAGSVTTSLGGAVVVSGNGVGDTSVTVDLSELLLGQTLTITYQVQIGAPALLGSTLTNTAQLDYDSLPGPGGRTGTDSDGAAVTLPTPTLTKSVVATSVPQTGANQGNPALQDLVIGETVTFDLVVTMPEGSAPLLLTDLLPTGTGILSLVSSQVLAIGSSLSGSLLPVGAPGIVSDTNADGLPDRIVFDFGTVTNNPDGVANAGDQIVVRIVALAADVAANSAGDVLTNQSTLDFGTGTANADASVEIVEPQLILDKSSTPETVLPGDLVRYTIVVQHAPNSTAAAFDLVIADMLPDGLVLTPGSVTTSAGTIVEVDGGIRIELDVYALGAAPIEITYTATIADDVEFGAELENTATVVWDSVDGPGGRPGTDDGMSTVSNLGFSYDGFNDFAPQANYDSNEPDWGLIDERWNDLPRLTLDPLYSGTAQPGATVSLTLHGQHGAVIGPSTVIADAGGNWLVSFPSAQTHTAHDWTGGTLHRIVPTRIFDQPTGVIEVWRPIFGFVPRPETVIGTSLEEYPHGVQLEQHAPVHTDFDTVASRRRAYFTGALDASVFVHGSLSDDRILEESAGTAVAADLQGASEPFGTAWNKFNLDFLAASGSPDGR